jgi:hypothetical protein
MSAGTSTIQQGHAVERLDTLHDDRSLSSLRHDVQWDAKTSVANVEIPLAYAFANLMLFGSPLIIALLFAMMPVSRALMVSVVFGYLFLPEDLGLDLPLLPAIDKYSLPVAVAFVMCLLFEGRQRKTGLIVVSNGWLPRDPAARLLVIMYMSTPFFTVLTNTDTIVLPAITIQAQSLYDIGSDLYTRFASLLPFILARRYVSDSDAQSELLRIFLIMGFVYSLLMAFEIRMSPQLHGWIYGFTPFEWMQQLRGDGFRPVVFLNHGLWTAIFLATVTIGAAAFYRFARRSLRPQIALLIVWFLIVVILSKSFGAMLLTLLFLPVALLLGGRSRLLVAAAVGLMVLLYPMLRSVDLVPTDTVIALAQGIDEKRSASLRFRLDNEDILLAHANERPLFGWGGWGRNQIFDEETGRRLSTLDGRWIITFGRNGWFGYIAEYGLLTVPLLLLFWRWRQLEGSEPAIALSLMLSVNLIDTLPNGTLTPLTWLMAGAVLGRVELRSVTDLRLRGERAGGRPNRIGFVRPLETAGTTVGTRRQSPYMRDRQVR